MPAFEGSSQRANFSIYTPQEELENLRRISEHHHFPLKIIPIGGEYFNVGYLVAPADKGRQHDIIAKAPITFIDFDDTLSPTVQLKKEVKRNLVNLKIPSVIVNYCDRLSRVSFGTYDSKTYYPEIDMRLLTLSLKRTGYPIPTQKKQLDQDLQDMLSFKHSIRETLRQFSIDREIERLFYQYRYHVSLFPDSAQTLIDLQGKGKFRTNLFLLTKGSPTFQLEKTIELLKTKHVDGIIFCKRNKSLVVDDVFHENPFKKLTITLDSHRETHGEGIDVFATPRSIVVVDDNEIQIKHLQEYSEAHNHKISTLLIQHRKGKEDIDNTVILTRHKRTQFLNADFVKIQKDQYQLSLLLFLTKQFQHQIERLIVSIYPIQLPSFSLNNFVLTTITSNPNSLEILDQAIKIGIEDEERYDIEKIRVMEKIFKLCSDIFEKTVKGLY